MERTAMVMNGGSEKIVADPVSFARSYQLEALEISLKQNTLVFFETGTGKTLIAIMLLRSYAHFLRKPSAAHIAVFLVPTVVLVNQQAAAVEMHTDLKVGKFYGEMGVDFWDASTWRCQMEKYEVLVMTPQILLDALRKSYLRLCQIKVLIFDECHNARGKNQYACIMMEFYQRELASNSLKLPRVFGMTASPIKAKASDSAEDCWKQISKLENLMSSKVFTCDSDSVLTPYISFSTPKLKMYDQMDFPHEMLGSIEKDLINLVGQHVLSLKRGNSAAKSAEKRLNKVLSTLLFCLTELGVWLAMKAAEVYSRDEEYKYLWGEMDVSGQRVLRAFCLDAARVFSAYMQPGHLLPTCTDLITNVRDGYITLKIKCLIDTLREYSKLKDLRCIIFVERIVTAIVICNLLNELLPEFSSWKTKYTAGNNCRLQSQSRKEQTAIVDEFRKGTVNIIVSTSMLEEGLDVQSCNLVIRFDPSVNVCSFIQSRGRARMHDSDFILMVKSGDHKAISRVKQYLASGDVMRRECLSHADVPCLPLSEQMYGEPWYQVGSTGAIATLNSSVALLYFYCSKLPSDGYFNPSPRCTIDKVLGTCTLQLPNSSPIQIITVQGDIKTLKQHACLEACKKLHHVGALTDNLVPDVVEEEAIQKKGNEPYLVEYATYLPPELIGCGNQSEICYYCYLIEMRPNFQYDIKVQDVLLAVQRKLDNYLEMFNNLDLDVDRGKLIVSVKYIGYVTLDPEQIALCQRFQITLLRVLIDHKLDKHPNERNEFSQINGSNVFNYLLLPCISSNQDISIDWKSIKAVQYQEQAFKHTDSCSTRGHAHYMHTRNGLVCLCLLENSLVCTPHNNVLYSTCGILDGIDGNAFLKLGDGSSVTYKKYYEQRHGIKLQFEGETFLKAKRIFTVHNYLHKCRKPSTKESSNSSTCELPPELCSIIMSPISISTVYSFSFLPSIMHRIESLLLAANLRSMPEDHCMQNVFIPTYKILEAITTKNCQENFHMESLETLGDSFLKYAASQQLFKTYQNRHEGLLSIKREKIICNSSLCKLGCDRKITGFIRDEPFNPKTWIIPGTNCTLREEMLSSKKVYIGSSREIKSKRVADVVEALIGAFLCAGGEMTALSFMAWLGIDVDFVNVPYKRNFTLKPELHVNIKHLESLLKYKFKDASLLVEALTHGSYMLPEIPGCYQRLEFLGDAVLDYLITVYLYQRYPGLSPGLLTDLRSASVNNDCYAQSVIKAELYKHILHISPELQRQIVRSISNFKELSSESNFGWGSITFPKVLGDVMESIAGAIFVDSGYDKEKVFESMKPLLEPLITPETLKLHPVRELNELCQKEHYVYKKPQISKRSGLAYATVEVVADGVVYKEVCSEGDKKVAKRLACEAVLKSLKGRMLTG